MGSIRTGDFGSKDSIAFDEEIRLVGGGRDAHEPPIQALILKSNDARDFGKERIILANSHIVTRLESRTALPHEDRPTRHPLATKAFHAKPLGIRIATVPGASYTLLMSHFILSNN